MILGNEPPDIASYAQACTTFPHQTTSDQWFNETQTESYRMLGKFTVNEICRESEPDARWDRTRDLAELPDWVKFDYLGMMRAARAQV